MLTQPGEPIEGSLASICGDLLAGTESRQTSLLLTEMRAYMAGPFR